MIFLLTVLAADENVRHYHRGRLPKYELSPPSIMLSDGDEEALSQGRALMQVIVGEDGERRRLLMVRDVGTPAWVVFDRILDFDAYPRMIKGCDSIIPYADSTQGKLRVMKAAYEIHAGPMGFKYFMLYEVDLAQMCMAFHLDYDRRGDRARLHRTHMPDALRPARHDAEPRP